MQFLNVFFPVPVVPDYSRLFRLTLPGNRISQLKVLDAVNFSVQIVDPFHAFAFIWSLSLWLPAPI
jgi:hypothetical protein